MKLTSLSCLIMFSAVCAQASAQLTVRTEAERDRANLTAEANYPVTKFQSTRTRAEVVAELERAQRQGQASQAMPASGDKKQQLQPRQPRLDKSLYNGA